VGLTARADAAAMEAKSMSDLENIVLLVCFELGELKNMRLNASPFIIM
jgi:hypothetical protein